MTSHFIIRFDKILLIMFCQARHEEKVFFRGWENIKETDILDQVGDQEGEKITNWFILFRIWRYRLVFRGASLFIWMQINF